ncbi:MAG: hypothetical protein ABFD54_01650 [Armatimonadota bacterium]|nr:hypothetical protein [bacterium]
MSDASKFAASLGHAVDKQDTELLKAMSDDLFDHILSMEGDLEESIFQIILEFMCRPDFQDLEGAWHLLFNFKTGWEDISDDQKQRLLPVLEETYPLYTHWMTCFTISGLLGEFYHDERALLVLGRLAKIDAEMPRSFVPHGLEHLINDSISKDITHKALSLIYSMREDASEKVRGEVEESLGRLARTDTGRKPPELEDYS